MPSPSDAISGHLDWYFTARAKGEATSAEIDAHFAPEYRWDWGSPREPAALEAWFGRWRDLWSEIVEVTDLGMHRRVVATRFGGGGVARIWFEFEEASPHRILRTATSEARFATEDADIARHTAVVRAEDGRWSASIHPSFTTPGGPFGGYLAALALRAAEAATDLSVPRSLACHFAHVGHAGPLDVDVVQLRRGRRLESLRVELAQDGAPLVSALVWAAAGTAAGSDDGEASAVTGSVPDRAVRLFGGAVQIGLDAATGGARCMTAGFGPGESAWLHAARLLLPFDWLAVQAVGWAAGPSGLPDHQLQSLDTTFTFVNGDDHTPAAQARTSLVAEDGDVTTVSVDFWNDTGRPLGRGTQQVLRRRIGAA